MRILVANFFPAFHPPRSGGEQRYYYLYQYLSRYFDVTLVSPTYSNAAAEVVTFSPSFREHRVPKETEFDQLHWKLDTQGIGPECSGYVVALAGARDTLFGRQFAELAQQADLIIHESPFTLPYDRTLAADGRPRIYNAYNVEHRLAAQLLLGSAGRKAVEFIRFLEKSLATAASLVLATSEEERQQFVADFAIDPDKIILAPNGFEPTERSNDVPGANGTGPVKRTPYAIFMGSAHPPNVEAAQFIVRELAPRLPDLDFRIIGAVCEHLPTSLPQNVQSLGFLVESDKALQLRECAIALNPLASGAGTNLKMLDYMAAGAPIITSPVGARGLDLEYGLDACIVENAAFESEMRMLLRDTPLAKAMGMAAKEKAFSRHTWQQIAEDVRDEIIAVTFERRDTHSPRACARPLLLVVNDFPVSGATGGGQVRISELMKELGRQFDVVVLCLHSASTRFSASLAPGVRQIAIPKTVQHRKAEARATAEAAISVNDLIASEFVLENSAFIAEFEYHAAHSSAVVFEHPYLQPLATLLPDTTPVVYSSLNVEGHLKATMLKDRPRGSLLAARAIELERRILDRADLTICVSIQDKQYFSREYAQKRFEVIENGARFDAAVAVANDEALSNDPLHGRCMVVFIGSGHMPNVEAAAFLVSSVAPKLPDLIFGIIGSVCDAIGLLTLPSNVVLFGVLNEEEKNGLLRRAAIAAIPLFEGGGSSLKVPDCFAAGLALVSTEVGVRGYELQPGIHYVSAGRTDFAHAVRTLSLDGGLRKRIATAASEYGRKYLDWRVLGSRYRRTLHKLIHCDFRPRVLAVTYRFADPPPGGAETFMVNVLRELDVSGKLRMDVATCDVRTIVNKWHFSASYYAANSGDGVPPYINALFRFPVDEPREGDFQSCVRLFHVWMAETRQQATMLPFEYERPVLLGGWNFAEGNEGNTTRWTSAISQVYVGEDANALKIMGHSPRSARIELMQADTMFASKVVDGDFEWMANLAGQDVVVTLHVSPALPVGDDPRELGVMVRQIATTDGNTWRHLNLGEDFESVWRRDAPEHWVSSLRKLTEMRPRSDDDLFIAVRGPQSSKLRSWLAENIANYDVVLAQGVPFSTPVDVADEARRQTVPLMLLPHFHMEDRYYHWRRYYDAFRDASCVIAAPAQAKTLFFDPLGATSVLVPGGGVDLSEFADSSLEAGAQRFRTLHHGRKPFVLVLGRKSGAKKYDVVVDAVQSINRNAHSIDLVLIGPDEDGIKVTAPHTYCYGTQPRDVVLGALSQALCLVNMSESESFGIVLLEAWLAGRPVIAQRKCVAFNDLVVPGKNGFLAESLEEVQQAVTMYLADESLAKSHSCQGGKLARGYSWSEVSKRLERSVLSTLEPGTRFECNPYSGN